MTTHRFFGALFIPQRSDRRFDGGFGLNCVSILAALCLLVPQVALSQAIGSAVVRNAPAEGVAGVTRMPADKAPVESEIAGTTMITYGNYRIFGAAPRCNIWTVGVEYDRHSWGHLLKAQVDYVAEVLPFVILSEPLTANFWGGPTSPYQQLVHGVGVSPIGFRMLWRSNMKVKPYMTGKAGGIFFPEKILSPNSSYANFNFQGDFGLEIRLSDRVELRMVPVEYFHVSNGYFAASNPGFDELAGKFGISYHLGRRGGR